MDFNIVDNIWILILLMLIGIVIVFAWLSTKVDMTARQIRTIIYISDSRHRLNPSSSLIYVQRYNRFTVTAVIGQSLQSNIETSTSNSLTAAESLTDRDKSERRQSISLDRTGLEIDDDNMLSQSKEISIRIKHVDEKESNVITLDSQTISDFKKDHFSDQLSQGRTVRLIYNGQELKEMSSTLREYGVKDKSIIHCLIVSPRIGDTSISHNESSDANNTINSTTESRVTDIAIQTLLFPLVGILIILLWYLRICYRHYFNVITTFGLIGATLIYLVSCITCFDIANHLLFHQHNRHHHLHSHIDTHNVQHNNNHVDTQT